jgi:hypothetical protein
VAETQTQPKHILISVALYPEVFTELRRLKDATGAPMKLVIDQALRKHLKLPPRKA